MKAEELQKTLRYNLNSFQFPKKLYNFVVYTLATKQSRSGFSSNDRLFLFHSEQNSLRYYRQLPTICPFTSQSHIHQGKQKLIFNQLESITIQSLPGKNQTMNIKWKAKDKNMEEWNVSFSNHFLKNQWVQLLNWAKQGKKDQLIRKFCKITNQNLQSNTKTNNAQQNSKPNTFNNILQNNSILSGFKGNTAEKSNIAIPNPSYSNNEKDKLQYNNHQFQNNNLDKPTAPTTVDLLQVNLKPISQNPPFLNPQPQKSTLSIPLSPQQNPINHNQPLYKNLPINQPNAQPNNIPALPTDNPSDIAQEIKLLSKNKYKLFNKTNELSQKNLHEAIQPQIHLDSVKPVINNKPIVDFGRQQNYSSRNKQPNKSICSDQISHIDHLHMSNQTESYSAHKRKPLPSQRSQRIYDNIIEQENQQYNISKKKPMYRRNNSQTPLQQEQKKSIHFNSNNNKSNFLNQQQNYLNNQFLKRKLFNNQQSKLSSKKSYNQVPEFKNRLPEIQKADKWKQQLQQIEPSHHVQRRNQEFYKWSQQFAESQNKLEIYEKFIIQTKQCVTQMIDQIPNLKCKRKYHPITQTNCQNIYQINGIQYRLHHFNNAKQMTTNYSNNPIIYDQQTYQNIKRQFYNYNLILSITNNQSYIKIPLCCYHEYKGIIVSCKSIISNYYQQSQMQEYKDYFQDLQSKIHVRFIFGSFKVYSPPCKQYILINDLEQLIPTIPGHNNYFLQEFLLDYQQILEDLQSSTQAHQYIIQVVLDDLIAKLDAVDCFIVSTHDLQRQLKSFGLSYCYLQHIYKRTTSIFYKNIIMSQITAQIMTKLLRSELNNSYNVFPSQELKITTKQITDNIFIQIIQKLINDFFSFTQRSELMWREIVRIAREEYNILIQKQKVNTGYLLSSILSKNGLELNKEININYQMPFFMEQNALQNGILHRFLCKTTKYNLKFIARHINRVVDIITAQPTNTQLVRSNYKELIELLNLDQNYIPFYLQGDIQDQLKLYLSNFIPYNENFNYEHLNLYENILYEPYNASILKLALMAIKWLIKKKDIQNAINIFQQISQKNVFWLGQFNPSIIDFYDFFAMYYVSIGNYQESISYAKASLICIIKQVGNKALPVADKRYQLGNIFYKYGKKQQSLKQYYQTKQILTQFNQIQRKQYGIILLKISSLNLHFGQINKCIQNSLQSLKIMKQFGEQTDKQKVQLFQLLSRSYQINQQLKQLTNISIICSKMLNSTKSIFIFCRMLKITLFHKLSNLSSQQNKLLLSLLSKLDQSLEHLPTVNYFNHLHKMAEKCIIVKRLFYLIDNAIVLCDQINRNDLISKYKTFVDHQNCQSMEFIAILDAVANIVGYPFLIGSLTDQYYE